MSDKKISQLTGATTPLAGTEVLPVVQSGVTKQVSVDNLTAGKNVKALSLSVNTSSATGKVTVNGDVQAQGSLGTLTGSLGIAIGAASGAVSGNDMCVIAADAYSGYKNLIISPRNNGADVGDTIFPVGNIVIGTSGKGIDFSADGQAAGMTSELLDDYEEGTWTPAVTASGGSGAASYTTQEGTYTKVGRTVTAIFSLSFSANTLSGGAISLSGLPFTSNSSGFSENFVLIDALSSNITSPILQVGASSTSCLLLKDSGTTNLHDTVAITVLGGGAMTFRGTITYFAA